MDKSSISGSCSIAKATRMMVPQDGGQSRGRDGGGFSTRGGVLHCKQ